MSKLDCYEPTHYPNNKILFLHNDSIDEIIIGGSCNHIFELPFKYSECIKAGWVIYKQGFEEKLRLQITPEMVTECKHRGSTITVKLTPEMTLKFDSTLLDTHCQLRLIDNNSQVLYDKPHEISVAMPLVKETINDEE